MDAETGPRRQRIDQTCDGMGEGSAHLEVAPLARILTESQAVDVDAGEAGDAVGVETCSIDDPATECVDLAAIAVPDPNAPAASGLRFECNDRALRQKRCVCLQRASQVVTGELSDVDDASLW